MWKFHTSSGTPLKPRVFALSIQTVSSEIEYLFDFEFSLSRQVVIE